MSLLSLFINLMRLMNKSSQLISLKIYIVQTRTNEPYCVYIIITILLLLLLLKEL